MVVIPARMKPIGANTTIPTAIPMPAHLERIRERVIAIPRATMPITKNKSPVAAVASSGSPYMSLLIATASAVSPARYRRAIAGWSKAGIPKTAVIITLAMTAIARPTAASRDRTRSARNVKRASSPRASPHRP
jgi:hypothetical protein